VETKINVVIPRDRIGVLIGPQGRVKAQIEQKFNVKICVDSETGVVEIAPKPGSSDPIILLRARDFVTAIARGFSPENASQLFNEDTVIEVLDLREIFGKSEADIKRIKGRVIGKDGKTRRIIEEMTDANISVYGHTIALLGGYEPVSIAREAVEMLIKGRQHATVYRFLRRKRREIKKRARLELWEKPPEGA
jgi:ribosomal RNA assembly protein